ncbi:Rv3654c family TadE-like protein [Streptomyces sp. Ag109_O5-1]|uniref:Rv3654c family TadE-like protein n=1 Tax=Streptomyces sp. Ag109_O5-1 TaxID=1938851 RepID=UPI000F4EC2E6
MVLTLRLRGGRSRPRGGAANVTAPRPYGALDRGSATVWSVGAIAVLCVVFGVVLGLAHAVVARHRAAGGADMAALAAADHWAEGTAAACDRADQVARAQGARLTRCVVVGDVSDVTAASGKGPFTAEVRARAAPAGDACDALRRGAGHCAASPHQPAVGRQPQAPTVPSPPSASPPAPPSAGP